MEATDNAPAPQKRAKRHDHRVDIYQARDAYSADLARAESGEKNDDGEGAEDWAQYLSEEVLEIDHMCDPNDPDRYRIRFVLGIGGPHVEVCVDSRDGVTFFHSWGKKNARHNAKDIREVEVHGSDRKLWERLADYYREGLGH